MSIYIGCDNGLSGGLAAYGYGKLTVIPMPVVTVKSKTGTKHEYDVPAIVAWFDSVRVDGITMVILEKAQSMPLQGVTSTFSIGKGYGIMQGILVAMKLPYTIVGPKTWQKAMFSDIPHEDTKAASRTVAQRIFPGVSFLPSERSKKDSDGMTDAALMAYYGSITYK